MNPPRGDLILSGVSNRASSLTIVILSMKFESKLTFEDYVRNIVSNVLRELVFWGWWSL